MAGTLWAPTTFGYDLKISIMEGPWDETIPYVIWQAEGGEDGGTVSYTQNHYEPDDPLITRSPNVGFSGSDELKVKVEAFNFNRGTFNAPLGTNARGVLVLKDVATNTEVLRQHSASNTTGAKITHTFTINLNVLPTDTLYEVNWSPQVYGGDAGAGGSPLVTKHENNVSHRYRFYFVTNRRPDMPVITGPPNGSTVVWGEVDPNDSTFSMTWTRSDADDVPSKPDYGGYEIQYRPVPVPGDPVPAWIAAPETGDLNRLRWRAGLPELMPLSAEFYAGPVGGSPSTEIEINAPGTYQFRLRVFDTHAILTSGGIADAHPSVPGSLSYAVSDWSSITHVNIVAPFLPPIPLNPINQVAQETDEVTFQWLFRDPRETGGTQDKRSVRIRLAGEAAWTEILSNDVSTSEEFVWTNGTNGFTIEPGFRYEWQPNTVADPGDEDAEWTAEVASFWAIPAPGTGAVIPTPDLTVPDPGLGCGDNRVFVYARGGVHRLGEITNKTQVRWSRVRDDISEATVQISGWSDDCGQLLAALRCWQMELVIFRDNGSGMVRVWEGPITRITYEKDAVEVAAHDCMAYVYRRVLRIGFNDAFTSTGGGLTPVTQRAAWVIQNALSYDDPNLLAYMQVVFQPDDARNSRVVPEYSTTAWQLVDDFAAKSGLDYVTVGRRIILWDTHNAIGHLPEMRDGDFGTPPIVTEYGMQLANYYAVTNNNGVWGEADRLNSSGLPDYYGWIEMLSSAYGESDEAASTEVLTAEARARLVDTLNAQAERNIANRYPTPLVARVPDNSTLNPELNVGINQLIPGVHIPLRSNATLREVTQMQKLDRMEVTQTDKAERISVTMSPAPLDRQADPDSGESGEVVDP